MKSLLKTVFTRIATVTAIKWIDEDFGQIDVYEAVPPVSFPCALVTIDEADDSQGGDEYDVSNTITVRVAHNRLGDRSAKAGDTVVDLTLAKLDQVEAVRDALKGYSLDGVCGTLYLQGITSERRTDGIAVKVLRFKEDH